MTSPTDSPESGLLQQARAELREGIEVGKQMVRQTRTLIELSETDPPASLGEQDCGIAN